jgi:glycosyltransferase involved in cell wall biosynthesis
MPKLKRSTKVISVIVPAYNEEFHIKKMLSNIPSLVDSIIVVNDGSTDNTKRIVTNLQKTDSRISLINHPKNMGLGTALITGYVESLRLRNDITVVMAGDNQMDPLDLENIVKPLILDEADYVKGNRLFRSDVKDVMPGYRYMGNSLLTFLSKFATGYWHVTDPQCGYTAISSEALRRIPIDSMTKGYGYNAHILQMLNIANMRVTDVEVRPIYGPNTTKIKLRRYVPLIIKLLFRLFIERLLVNFVRRDFHPLVLFYILSLINGLFIALPLGIRFLYLYFTTGLAPTTTLILFSLTSNIAILSFFFAIWMDMEARKHISVSTRHD